MAFRKPSAISIVEHAYDLQDEDSVWITSLTHAVAPLLDSGRGVLATLWSGSGADGVPFVSQIACESVALLQGYASLMQATSASHLFSSCPDLAGCVNLMSETRPRWPDLYDLLAEHLSCEDVLSFFAIDLDLSGVVLSAPSDTSMRLSPRARQRMQRLAIHIASGARLRRPSAPAEETGIAASELPKDAEALLDPKHFKITDATGPAKESQSLHAIRDAAIRVDRARSKRDDAQALELWQGLVGGRWSLVDWFDHDERRYVLAKPNPPNVGDPRGLSNTEALVATYSARGESNKLIAYRLGVTPQRVSVLRRHAMVKLGVCTQAQLLQRMHRFAVGTHESS